MPGLRSSAHSSHGTRPWWRKAWTHWNGAVNVLLANLNTIKDWIATARETKVLETSLLDTEASLMTTEAQLKQAMSDIEVLSQASEGNLDTPSSTGNDLLVPSSILAIGIVIAALLVIQKDKL